jgi:dynein heavy chain
VDIPQEKRVKNVEPFSLPHLEKFVPYLLDLEKAELPPLLKKFSWTLTAPFKEEKYQRLVSDSIANNYSPSASHLSLKLCGKTQKKDVELAKGAEDIFTAPESPPLSPCSRTQKSKFSTIKIEADVMELDPVEFESQTISRQITPEQRYWFYVESGINNDSIYKLESDAIIKITKLIDLKLLDNKKLQETYQHTLEEVKVRHVTAIKQSIVDYILIDIDEQKRLSIPPIFDQYVPMVARGPVPWHESLLPIKLFNEDNLFITNPMMVQILGAFEKFKNIKIMDTSVFDGALIPLPPVEFKNIVIGQMNTFKGVIVNEWIPTIVNLFLSQKDKWYSIATDSPDQDLGFTKLDNFFKSVTALMSNQLWSIVLKCLDELNSFFKQYENCNSQTPIFLLSLNASGSQIRFEPPLMDLEELVLSLLQQMVQIVSEIPRIETKIFASLAHERLFIPCITLDDDRIDGARFYRRIISKNSVNPQKHLLSYDKHKVLLNHKAEKKIEDFLREKHELEDYEEVYYDHIGNSKIEQINR